MDIEGFGTADLAGAEHPADLDCDLGGHDLALPLADTDHDDVTHDDVTLPTDVDHPPTGDPHHSSLVVDTPYGPHAVGPATEDTNGDGRADTAVVPSQDGLLLVTDTNGDGTADQVVDIDDNGEMTVSRHTGPGHWTVTASGMDVTGHHVADPKAPAVGSDDSDWVFEETTHTGPPTPPEDSDSVWV